MTLVDRVLQTIGLREQPGLHGLVRVIPERIWLRALSIHAGWPEIGEVSILHLRDSRFWSYVVQKDDPRALLAAQPGRVAAAKCKSLLMPYRDLSAVLWAVSEQDRRGSSERNRMLQEEKDEALEFTRADQLVVARWGPFEPYDRSDDSHGDEEDPYAYRHRIHDERREQRARSQIRRLGREAAEIREARSAPSANPGLLEIAARLLAGELEVHERALGAPEALASRTAALRSRWPKLPGEAAALFAEGLLRLEDLERTAGRAPFDRSSEALPFWKGLDLLVEAEFGRDLVRLLDVARDMSGLARRRRDLDLGTAAALLARYAQALDPRVGRPGVRVARSSGDSCDWHFPSAEFLAEFSRAAIERLGPLDLPSPTRSVWIAAALDHFRTVLRNGFAHADRADRHLVDHLASLLAPESGDGLLAFVLGHGQDVPGDHVRALLRTSLDFRAPRIAPAGVEYKVKPADVVEVSESGEPVVTSDAQLAQDPNHVLVRHRVNNGNVMGTWEGPPGPIPLDRTRIVVTGDASAVELAISPPGGTAHGAFVELRCESKTLQKWEDAVRSNSAGARPGRSSS